MPGVYKVGGLGDCTLISKKVFESNVSYDKIYNVSFWGEDRHFCIRAAVLGFELYVDTHYQAFHIYRTSYLKKPKPLPRSAVTGSLISTQRFMMKIHIKKHFPKLIKA